MFFLLGLMSTHFLFPRVVDVYLRKFHPKKSNPLSKCDIRVFSLLSSKPISLSSFVQRVPVEKVGRIKSVEELGGLDN